MSKRILHFEDESMLAQLYGTKLSNEGFEYKHYLQPPKTKEELIKLVIKYKPDLIIMDIIMPVMDGIQATKYLKEDTRTKDIPILGFDNIGQEEQIEEFIECGMVDYLVKAHYTPSEVVQLLNTFLNNPEGYVPRAKRVN